MASARTFLSTHNGHGCLRGRWLPLACVSIFLTACSYDLPLPVEWPDTRPERQTVPQTPIPEATTRAIDIEQIPVGVQEQYGITGEFAREQKVLSSTLPEGVYPRRIALLLPLSSPLGRAAEAFQRGFMEAQQRSPQRVEVRVYDTGAEHELASLYYLSAINDGYDMAVGPFGKKSVDALLQSENMAIPALLIGQLPNDRFVANAWGLSLSPEYEARVAAERALAQGYTSAAVLHRNNGWGLRIAEAFNQAFQAGGGQVVSQNRFQPGANQASTTIQRLLGLDQSERRHKQLTSALGRSLGFSASRRSDVDVIFYAGNANEARSIVPQLKFFRAHDLPVLATSSAFSGRVEPVTDADLAGLSFPDLPWMLNGLSTGAAGGAQRLQSQARGLPYGGSALDRLYALGKTAFSVIPQVNALTRDSQAQHYGSEMAVRADDWGNLQPILQWAHYSSNGIRVEGGRLHVPANTLPKASQLN